MADVSGKRGPGQGGGADPRGLAGVGIQFAAILLAFLFGGRWLDARLGTEPWLLIAGVFVGFALSTYWMYRRLVPPSGPGGRK